VNLSTVAPIRRAPVRRRLVRSGRFVIVTSLVVASGLFIMARHDAAAGDGTPDISLSASTGGEVLYGRDVTVSLTASNGTGTDGFNLSFQDVLPVGVSYVAGSASPAPTVIVRGDGTTALIWPNVSDLFAGTDVTFSYDIRPDIAVYDAGATIATAPAAFVNSDPRFVPDFDTDGAPVAGAASYTGNAATTTSTDLVAFRITKREPNAERELLRGVHDHQTVYTVRVDNNDVNPTTGFSVVDHLPAGLEFLGCGTVDNTTDAAAAGQEYPGSGVINPGNAPALGNPCPTPSGVTTVTADPDGAGPLGNDVYTRVEWNSAALAAALTSADLAAGASFEFDYVAAIPLRENVQAALGDPTANLDNNTGALTADEQSLVNHAEATGTYQSVLDAPSVQTDDDTFEVIAEDVSIHKSVDTGTFVQGSTSTWTLLVENSEYARSTGPITVADTIPDGLAFATATPTEDGGFPAAGTGGTQVVRWTLGGFTVPSDDQTITFTTTTLTDYRDSGRPVASNDSWTNTVDLATDATVITDGDGSTSVIAVVDASSAGQSAGGLTILKEVSEPVAGDLTCGDGSGVSWQPSLAGDYRPGDRVCWRLSVDFPLALDTLAPRVQDYLPPGFVYDSWTTGAGDDGPAAGSAFTDSSPLLAWDLGDVDVGGLRFEAIVQTVIDSPGTAADGDILSNLMKFRYENTAGEVFQRRDLADVSWTEPELTLAKGVIDVDDVLADGGAQAVGTVTVENGDVVTYQLRIDNAGGEAALAVDVRDTLPDGITCADISNISDGGTCDVGNTWIEWPDSLGLTVPGGGSTTLTYDLTVPLTTTAGTTLQNVAGVRTYQGDTNDPGNPVFVFVPEDNIDPGLTPNTDPADDDAVIRTGSPTIAKTRTTGITETGNNTASEATIGETIDYTVTLALPGGTTYYGPVEITDDLPPTLDLVTAVPPVVTRNAVAVSGPDGFTITSDGGTDTVTVTFPLDGDSSYKVANGTPETFVLTFRARVLDVESTDRGDNLANRVDFDYTTDLAAPRNINASVNTRIVEPNIQIAKSNDLGGSTVDPDQQYSYTLTVTNPTAVNHVSTAHDLTIVDGPIPAELIVLDAGGDPASDGDPVDGNGGTWNATTRQITWTASSLAPGSSLARSFDVRTVDPLLAADDIVNDAAVTATSLAGADAGERDDTPEFAGYHAEAQNSVAAPSLPVVKSGTPNSRTIGDPITFTVDFTIPANVIAYDVTVIDDLPAGLAYESLTSVTCDQGGACSPDVTAADVTTDGDVVSFFVGDLTSAAAADRVVTVTYVATVDDDVAATAGATFTNSASVSLNQTDRIAGNPGSPPAPGGFDQSSGPATDDTTVVEPSLSVDKDVAGQVGDTDQRRAKPGDTLTYTVTVTNASGATVSDAHDLTIVDTPDTLLTNYTPVSASAGVTPVDADATDGTLSWSYAGPLAPGASISITYAMDVPDGLDESDEVAGGPEASNTADVTSYFGASSVTRTAHPGRSYRDYDDVTPDTVDIEIDLASIGDVVWHDVDGDGVQDPGEPALAGVDVTVTHLGDDDTFGTLDDEAVTVATDASGLYVVTELPGGLYRVDVDETDPDFVDGLVASYDLDGAIATPDGRWNGTLAEDAAKRDVDFGYTGDGSIGDTIFFDHDGDGAQDPGEGGIAGVDVVVVWYGPDGVVGGADDVTFATATTDASGNYLVDLLPAGNFSVTVQGGTLPVGQVLVSDPQGALDGVALVSLTLAENDLGQDFGARGTGSIGDTIYLDRDGDGVQDASDPGLGGVTVQLEFAGADGTPTTGDDSTLTTTTNGSGNYLFRYLPPGAHIVTVIGGLPAVVGNTGDPDGGGDSTADLTLGNGATDLAQDFGYDADSVLGDRVWWDLDGDGVQDAGEPGIDGVTVTASGPNGITLTTTTSGDGDYLFADVVDGDWTVGVTAGVPSGFSPTYDADGGNDATSDVTLTTSDLGQDFGYVGDSSIGDRVWLDRDGDGVQDGGEPGIELVTVTLTWFGPDDVPGGGDDVVLTTETDADGDYLFPALPGGEYTVVVDDDDADFPAGVDPTYDRDGGTSTPDGATEVTLAAATDLVDVDFGYRGGATLGDLVWFDRDGDGTRDADEPGLPGVDVTATWYGEDGTLGNADDEVFTDVTDASGAYGLVGLPAGDYDVVVDSSDLPTGFGPSFDPDGGFDDASSLMLGDGQIDLAQDFGYRGPAEVGDLVWFDRDGDGVRDAGEPGIPGQIVTVKWDGPSGGVPFLTITASDGSYGVDGLPDGAVTVAVVGGVAAAATNTADPDGGADSTSTTVIAGGADDLDQDFGFAGPNSIGELVWWDIDGDGVVDAGEPRLAGIEITLTWFGIDGEPGGGDDLTFVTTTGAAGRYLFTGLPDGNYAVEVTGGLTPGRDTRSYDEDDGTVSPDLRTLVRELGVGVTSPVAHVTADFGVTGSGSIGDTIWLDRDGDGRRDPVEPGIPGVSVTLTWQGLDGTLGHGDDVVIGTVTTDADGSYLFELLPAGDFRIDLGGVPASLSSTADPDGGADDTAISSLAAGEDDLTQDFGYVGDASIGDLVWLDVDGDGVPDPGEPGLPGVTVTVSSAGVDGTLGTADDIRVITETDDDGNYLVVGLPGVPTAVTYDDGDLGPGLVPGSDRDGGDVTEASAVLEAGGALLDVDFAVVGTASLTGVVFDDRDRDGVQDPGEPGIPGVRVEIVWDGPDGPVTIVTTTGADGSWTVASIPAGDYAVTIVVDTLRDGDAVTTPITVVVTVPPGGNGSVDHGATPSASVGDRIWIDADRDGTQGAGEPGLPGIRVALLDGTGGVVATTTTDDSGSYLFADLLPGTYSIVVDTTTLPSGYVQTFDPDGTTDARSTVTLDPGEDDLTQDFGFATSTTSTPTTGTAVFRSMLIASLFLVAGAGFWLAARRRDPAES
jgi:fimbrial isopeptide formation D2 family protein/uncharacterized repeat protein (TIGR01451 family)